MCIVLSCENSFCLHLSGVVYCALFHRQSVLVTRYSEAFSEAIFCQLSFLGHLLRQHDICQVFLGHLLRHNLDSIFIIVVMQISTLSLNAAMLLYDVLLLARQVSDTTIRLIESPILKIFLIITKLFV